MAVSCGGVSRTAKRTRVTHSIPPLVKIHRCREAVGASPEKK